MPLHIEPLAGGTFGSMASFSGAMDANATVAAAEAEPHVLPEALYAANGFLLMKGMKGITEEPALLMRLSQLFGDEIEKLKTEVEGTVVKRLNEELGVQADSLDTLEETLKKELENRATDGLRDLFGGNR